MKKLITNKIIKPSIAKDIELSFGERISLFLRDLISKDVSRKGRIAQDDEQSSYLMLFRKAENIQGARYIEPN